MSTQSLDIEKIQEAMSNDNVTGNKERNNKMKWIVSLLALLKEMVARLSNQQWAQQEESKKLEIMLKEEAEASARKEAEAWLQWLEAEMAKIQANLKTIEDKSFLTKVEQVHQQLFLLSQQVAALSALRAEFVKAQWDVIEPAMAAIEEGLSRIEDSLASTLTPEKMRALCSEVENIHLKVNEVRKKVEDLFVRFEAAKADVESTVGVLRELKLDKEHTFEPNAPEFEAFNTFESLRKASQMEDIAFSLKGYKAELDEVDVQMQTITNIIDNQIKAQFLPAQAFSFRNQFTFFYSPMMKNGSTLSPKPSFGMGTSSREEDELLKAISKFSSRGLGRSC